MQQKSVKYRNKWTAESTWDLGNNKAIEPMQQTKEVHIFRGNANKFYMKFGYYEKYLILYIKMEHEIL